MELVGKGKNRTGRQRIAGLLACVSNNAMTACRQRTEMLCLLASL
ncbi:hypothetical protein [Hydrogeniiclostridium mannosilyticum]|nr:hypothetical protein [Hydrogeniiclostridium mannosilyticum]